MDDHCQTLHLWHVPSKEEWKIHQDAHKAVKVAQIPLCPRCRVSFYFVHAAKEVAYRQEWHEEFSALSSWGRGFLELVGLNRRPLKPTSVKGGHGVYSWHLAATHWLQRCAELPSAMLPLPSFSSWGANRVLVSPSSLANKGSHLMCVPEGPTHWRLETSLFTNQGPWIL